MIGIRINNKDVVLPDDFTSAIVINNPVLEQDIVNGDYTLPMALPYKANAKQFDFNHELLLASRSKTYAGAKLLFKKQTLFNGILDVLNIDGENINTSLRLNISGLLSISKKLRDFDMDVVHIGTDQDMKLDFANEQILKNYPDVPFNFPMIYHPDFYGDNNPDFRGYINDYESGVGFIKNIANNVNTLVPMVYLYHILKKCFAFDGFTLLDEAFMDDDMHRKLMVYNNYAIDKRFIGTIVDGFHAEHTTEDVIDQDKAGHTIIFNQDNDGFDNYDPSSQYDETTGKFIIPSTGQYSVYTRVKCQFGVNNLNHGVSTITIQVLQNGVSIASTMQRYPFGYTYGELAIFHTFTASPGNVGDEITVKVFFSNSVNHAMTIKLRAATVFAVNSNNNIVLINNYKNEVMLSEHMPDITFGELLNAFRKTFNLYFDIDYRNKTVKIDYFDNLLTRVPVQFKSTKNNRTIPGHIIQLTDEYVYKSFNFSFESDDNLVNNNFKPVDPNKILPGVGSYANLVAAYPPAIGYLGKYAVIYNLNQVWRCNETAPSSGIYLWEYYTDNFYPLVVDPLGTVELTSGLSPLFMHIIYDASSASGYSIFPQVKQRGSSDAFDLGFNEPSLRLFYFHGLSAAGAGGSYPFSTTTNRSNSGLSYGGSRLDWPKYLHALYKKKIDIFSSGAYFEKKVKLNLPDLLNFNILNPARIDNANFLIKNMSEDIGQELGEAKFTLFKI